MLTRSRGHRGNIARSFARALSASIGVFLTLPGCTAVSEDEDELAAESGERVDNDDRVCAVLVEKVGDRHVASKHYFLGYQNEQNSACAAAAQRDCDSWKDRQSGDARSRATCDILVPSGDDLSFPYKTRCESGAVKTGTVLAFVDRKAISSVYFGSGSFSCTQAVQSCQEYGAKYKQTNGSTTPYCKIIDLTAATSS